MCKNTWTVRNTNLIQASNGEHPFETERENWKDLLDIGGTSAFFLV